MAIYHIIRETKYFTLKEVRKEIQNILNEGIQDIDKFKLMDSINKALSNKGNNLTLECYYQFLLDAIEDGDIKEIKRYAKKIKIKV